MAYSPERIVGPQLLVNLPTNPVKTFTRKTIIKNITITNITNGNVIYNVWLDVNDSGAQNFNKIFPGIVVPANSITTENLALVANPGDKLFATATVPQAIILTISGVEVI